MEFQNGNVISLKGKYVSKENIFSLWLTERIHITSSDNYFEIKNGKVFVIKRSTNKDNYRF